MTKFEEIMTKTGQSGMAKYVAEQKIDIYQEIGRFLGSGFPELSAEEFEAAVIREFNKLNEEV